MADYNLKRVANGTFVMNERITKAEVKQPASLLPEEKPEPVRMRKVKAKLMVSPFALVGACLVALMAVIILTDYVRLYDATGDSNDLNVALADAKAQNELLHSQYESMVDFTQIEIYATSHGMRKPTAVQTIYVAIPRQDEAEIRIAQESSVLEKVWVAIREGFSGLAKSLR